MSGTPSATLGRYQIIREIARSNDIVYEAYDPTMNRRIALKELNVPGGTSPQNREERVRRFQREAKAAGSLSHPNIVTVYEVGIDQDRYFIAMEYLDGRNLRQELDASGFLKPDRAFEVAQAILEALDFAHRNGVVHRDVKPENVLLLADGRVKLTDFGIARLTFEPNITMDGQVFGTPSYMSPEQVIGREIDERSDLFSVGVILYEMLSGAKPFKGDNVVAISYAITNQEPDPLPPVHGAIWPVVRKALDKMPSLRYESARAMIDALRQARQAPATVYGAAPMPPPIFGTQAGGPIVPGPPPMPAPGTVPTAMPIATGYPVPTGQPPPNVPVYIPPPPRQPLLSHRASANLRRVMLILGIMIALAVMAVFGVKSLSEAIERAHAEREAVERRVALGDRAGEPIQNQIEAYRQAIERAPNAPERERLRRDQAVLLERQGNDFRAAGRYAEAEQAYLEALALDPYNPAYHTDLAALYDQWGRAARNLDERAVFHTAAAEFWLSAAGFSREQAARTYQEAAANLLYELSRQFTYAGRTNEATRYRDDALSVAPPGSAIERRIRSGV